MIDPDRSNFNPAYVENELDKLDGTLNEELHVFVLGGAVMAMDGLKTGTKDIDVIVGDEKSHDILNKALQSCGYILLQTQDLSRPYQELSATALQNLEGFRWEIFIKVVAKKLTLSDGMLNRARVMYKGTKLKVFRLSKEDIFLMKGMTSRDKDLEDMFLMAKS